jgi:hypothetical protein
MCVVNKTLELNKEYPPVDEAADIERMAALIEAIHHPQKDGRVLRAQHAKDTGCVKAQFISFRPTRSGCRSKTPRSNGRSQILPFAR